MKQNRSTVEALASILGLVIFIVVIMWAMNYFRQGSEEYTEAQRVAGRPITLAESLSEGEALTETAALTTTTPVTAATAVTATASTTATAAVSESAAVTTTAATTATTPLTTTAAVTEAAPVEVAAAITTTTPVTDSTEAAAEPTAEPTVEPTAEPTAAPTAEPTVEPTAAPAAAEAAPVAGGVPSAETVAPIFTKGTCVACHVIPNIPGAVGVIGPDLTQIGAAGATRIPGYTAEQYIRESILNPNAFIAPECPTGACLPGVMLQNLADILTPEEIDLVVAYLAAQGAQ